jgi:hypothetical protein
MHHFTHQLLERLWLNQASLEVVSTRLSAECAKMSPPEAGVIGRDLLLRSRSLCTKEFELAAYLASDGTAGNDGLIDFTDCVAILPEDRFQRVAENPDELIDDEVSTTFGEFHFVSEVTNVFDHALTAGEEGLLYYLVFGDDDAEGMNSGTLAEEEVMCRLPRLYKKFAHLLRQSRPLSDNRRLDSVTLDDLIQ